MFYVLSKLTWIIIQPLSLIFVALLLGGLACLLRWCRVGIAILAGGTLFAFIAIFTNLGQVLISPLEQHYVRPANIPSDVAGAIVLGGGINASLAKSYESYELNAAGDRLMEALRLAQIRPDLRILVTGGVGELSQDGDGDGVAAQRMFSAFGMTSERLMFETRSRTTFENAVNSKNLLGPDALKKKWLLVTSAFHMPRAMAVFEAQGFNVVPWPVDYRAPRHPGFGLDVEKGVTQLSVLTLAIHEWVGLAAYWVSGKTRRVWP